MRSQKATALTPTVALRDTAAMECPFNHEQPLQYYGDYLAIDQLLALQKPVSLQEGKLSVYVAQRPGRLGLLRFGWRALCGRLAQEKDFDAIRELMAPPEPPPKRRIGFR